MRQLLAISAALATLLFAQCGPTPAQTTGEPPPDHVDPKACAPGERLTPREHGPPQKSSPGDTLSEKLDRTDGVLCPPRVDPEMSDKPPDGGAMKVLPPPGTPENQPDVRPK